MEIQGYSLPNDLLYTRDHAWVKVEGDRIRIGITDIMQGLASDISFIRLPRAGKVLEEGKTLASVQSGKWAGKIMTPMAGTVVEANAQLITSPGLLNSSPYEDGWIAVMEPADLAAGLKGLMSVGDMEPWIIKELAAHGG
jgi:glycine cleavage system H protein